MDSQTHQLLANLQAQHEHMMAMGEDNNQEGETLLAASESETQSIQPTQTVFDSNKRLKADVWKEFIPIEIAEEDGKSRGRCVRSYKCLPSEDEWDRGEKIRDMLKPFSTITTYISGVNYPTANVYFSQVWKIECLLRKFSHCDDTAVREMAKSMQSKFTKYWDEYSIVLAMAAVLDPRIKLQILRVAFDKLDPRTSERRVEVVKKNLYALYEEYKTTKSWSSWTSVSSVSAPPTADELLNESPLEDDMNYDLFELEKSIQSGSANEKTNLDLYLNEPRLEMKSFTDMEVLDYWKNHGKRHGDLASLASDLLSIPITTVASESAFSIGSRVLTPYRNRLLPKNVQALLCTRNWLRGFVEFEGDIEDFFDDGDDDASSSSRT